MTEVKEGSSVNYGDLEQFKVSDWFDLAQYLEIRRIANSNRLIDVGKELTEYAFE